MPIQVIRCHEWGAVRVENSTLMRRDPEGIVVHHTAGPNRTPGNTEEEERQEAFALARAIQRHHMYKNGWRDSGHHFLVTRGGLILEGRNGAYDVARKGKVILGAHAGQNRANMRRFGVEVEGSYMESLPTPAAWPVLVNLCAWLCVRGDVDSAEIQGHRDIKQTACPGYRLYEALDDLRREVHVAKLELKKEEGAGG